MSLKYDQDIFDKYKSLAINNSDQLIVGQTYYSNHFRNGFTLKEIISGKEKWQRYLNNKTHGDKEYIQKLIQEESHDPRWIIDIDDNEYHLHDMNIDGGGYNPWLVFEDIKTRDECNNELVVQYRHYQPWWPDPLEYDEEY